MVQDTRLKIDVETSSDRRETCPGLWRELRDVLFLSWRHSASPEMLARALGWPKLSGEGRGLNNCMTNRTGQTEGKKKKGRDKRFIPRIWRQRIPEKAEGKTVRSEAGRFLGFREKEKYLLYVREGSLRVTHLINTKRSKSY